MRPEFIWLIFVHIHYSGAYEKQLERYGGYGGQKHIDCSTENVSYCMIYKPLAVLCSLMMYVCTYQKGGVCSVG